MPLQGGNQGYSDRPPPMASPVTSGSLWPSSRGKHDPRLPSLLEGQLAPVTIPLGSELGWAGDLVWETPVTGRLLLAQHSRATSQVPRQPGAPWEEATAAQRPSPSLKVPEPPGLRGTCFSHRSAPPSFSQPVFLLLSPLLPSATSQGVLAATESGQRARAELGPPALGG